MSQTRRRAVGGHGRGDAVERIPIARPDRWPHPAAHRPIAPQPGGRHPSSPGAPPATAAVGAPATHRPPGRTSGAGLRTARGHARAIPVLDAVRGLSALYVLSFHVVYWLHESGARLQERYGATKLLIAGNPLGLFGFGHQAVIVFFVLSGFVIHLRQAQRPGERSAIGQRAWFADYARRRAIRIYAPLLFALALTAAVGVVGTRLAGDFFGHPIRDRDEALIVMNDNIAPLDALFVVLPIGWTFGSNGPLWSIQYEIWFYAAYVVVLLGLGDRLRVPLRRTLTAATLAALAAWLALASGLLGHQSGLSGGHVIGWAISSTAFLVMYFPIWLAGSLLAEVYANGAVVRQRGLFAAVGLAMAVAGAAGQVPTVVESRIPFDYLFALGTVLLMASALLRAETPRPPGRALTASAFTAHWSYALYAVHFPLIMLVRGLWLGGDPVPSGFLLPLVGFLAGLAGGVVVWLLVERPSLRWAYRRSHRPPCRSLVGHASNRTTV